jgi:hypothetical protein
MVWGADDERRPENKARRMPRPAPPVAAPASSTSTIDASALGITRYDDNASGPISSSGIDTSTLSPMQPASRTGAYGFPGTICL